MKHNGLLEEEFRTPKSRTCIAKQEVMFKGDDDSEFKFYKLEEATWRFDKDENNNTCIIVTKYDMREIRLTLNTFYLYFLETDSRNPFIPDKDKILLVMYFRFYDDWKHSNSKQYEQLCQAQHYLERTFDYTIKAIVIPIYDGQTRLESLNPEMCSDEKLEKLNKNLDKWLETLHNDSEA